MPTSEFVDRYAVLGVARQATPQQIVAAHRRIALKNATGQLGLGDEAEQRLKDANAARTILLRDRARYDRQLAQHEARAAGAKGVGSPRSGVAAKPFAYARRTAPQPVPRPAQRAFDSIGLTGLNRANRTTATQAASTSQGRHGRNSAVKSSRAAPQLKPSLGFR